MAIASSTPDTPLEAVGLPQWVGPPLRSRRGAFSIFLVAALAFLLASFPARNADLLAHLAAGRYVIPGGEPVPSFSSDLPRPSGWLYDLLCFAAYSAFSGLGLVVVKALLVVSFSLALLRLSWAGRGWWLPAGCTALALIASSKGMSLQPATLSVLLLALALCFLPFGGDTPSRGTSILPPWKLLVLFAVWVNLDGGFVLGLGVVALVWLGQAIDGIGAERGALGEGDRIDPFVRVLASLVVLSAVALAGLSPVVARRDTNDITRLIALAPFGSVAAST